MIIENNSPLRLLPGDLNLRQALFLDAIRFSVEMADLAYLRLSEILWQVTSLFDDKEEVEKEVAIASAFMDAWSVVDSVDRMHKLLLQMPMKNKTKWPGFRVFITRTSTIEEVRNSRQHLQGEIPSMSDKGWPVWGALSWFALLDEEGRRGRSCVIVPGRFNEGTHPIVYPVGRPLQARVDHITLSCKSEAISLSDTIREVERLTKGLEQVLERQFKGLPRAGRDLFVAADMQFE